MGSETNIGTDLSESVPVNTGALPGVSFNVTWPSPSCSNDTHHSSPSY